MGESATQREGQKIATVNDIRANLQAQGYGADTEATQLRFLDRAWSRIMTHRRWAFNDTTVSVTLPAADNVYSLPSDCRYLDALRFVSFDQPHFLPYQQFRDYVGFASDTGTPRVYTRRGNTIIMYPTPSVAVSALVDYNRSPTKPSAVANVAVTDLAVPDVIEELLVLGAIKLMAFRERDVDSIRNSSDEYDQLLRDYMAEVGTQQRQNSQRIVQSGVHQAYTALPYRS